MQPYVACIKETMAATIFNFHDNLTRDTVLISLQSPLGLKIWRLCRSAWSLKFPYLLRKKQSVVQGNAKIGLSTRDRLKVKQSRVCNLSSLQIFVYFVLYYRCFLPWRNINFLKKMVSSTRASTALLTFHGGQVGESVQPSTTHVKHMKMHPWHSRWVFKMMGNKNIILFDRKQITKFEALFVGEFSLL